MNIHSLVSSHSPKPCRLAADPQPWTWSVRKGMNEKLLILPWRFSDFWRFLRVWKITSYGQEAYFTAFLNILSLWQVFHSEVIISQSGIFCSLSHIFFFRTVSVFGRRRMSWFLPSHYASDPNEPEDPRRDLSVAVILHLLFCTCRIIHLCWVIKNNKLYKLR